jgi:D-hydroxyproline dehydrogenase subunit gamma
MVNEIRIRGALERPRTVTLQVDGTPITAHAGESIAAALLAAGIRRLGESPLAGAPRGAFCYMGVCQECLVRIGGIAAQACITPVRDGMVIQLGRT